MADDSDAERASARRALEAAGYLVVEAVDGQHALEQYARERPDLVLLDVVMPRLTGLEACRILKAKTQASYLPVIMVSTRNSVNARVEGLRSGADDYLGKPYDPEELRARVEALLRARAAFVGGGDSRRKAPAAAVPREGKPAGAAEDPSTGELRAKPLHAGAFQRRLEEEFDRAERYSDPLACLRIELDAYAELARLDPTVAHQWVEQLRETIESSIRKIDLVFPADARGFALVLPNTHFPGALAVAERVWNDVRRSRLPASLGGGPTTVSIGVSFYPNKDTHSLLDLQTLVEAALERARTEGGGKICLFQHQGYLYAPEG